MNTSLIQAINQIQIDSGGNFLHRDKIEQNILCKLIELSKDSKYDDEEKINILNIALKKIESVKDNGFNFLYITIEELIYNLKNNKEGYDNIIRELENCYFE
jgi:hypothetical protein